MHDAADTRALAADRGAVALSSELASVHDLHIGHTFRAAHPGRAQRRYTSAAIITDYGWLPGAVALNPESYAAWWASRRNGVPDRLEPRRRHREAHDACPRRSPEPAGGGQPGPDADAHRRSGASRVASLRRTGQLIALIGLLAVTATTLAGTLGRIRRMSALRTIGMSVARRRRRAGRRDRLRRGRRGAARSAGVVGHALTIDYLSGRFALNIAFALSPSQFGSAVGLSAVTIVLADARRPALGGARAAGDEPAGDVVRCRCHRNPLRAARC